MKKITLHQPKNFWPPSETYCGMMDAYGHVFNRSHEYCGWIDKNFTYRNKDDKFICTIKDTQFLSDQTNITLSDHLYQTFFDISDYEPRI